MVFAVIQDTTGTMTGTDEVVRGLRRLARILQRHSSRAEREWGLTGPQLWALRELGASAPLALKDLAERLYLHPSTVVGIVDRLEAKGLAVRKADPEDRRRLRLGLSPRGARLARRIAASGLDVLEAGLADYPTGPRTSLAKALHALAGTLEARLDPDT